MINLRIIGSIWIVSSIIPAVQLAIELWSLATHQSHEPTTDAQGARFWISQLSVEAAFVLIALTGWGLLRLRRWAAIPGGFLGVISLVVCVWFILTQGLKHGPEPYVAIWCGVALSVYTLFGVWRFRRHNQRAEPGAAPNCGPITSIASSDVTKGPQSVT